MNKRGAKRDTCAKTIAAALIALLLFGMVSGCTRPPAGVPIVDIPPYEQATVATVAPTAEPAAAETAEPTGYALPTETAEPTQEPPTLEAQILSGAAYPLFNGQPLDKSWEGLDIDIDGDGAAEAIRVTEYDGGDTLTIDGEPFMDGGLEVTLVSFDGMNMLFCAQKAGEEELRFFCPDENGNLFCRLFGVSRGAEAGDLASLSTNEERIRAGLDIMLFNPLLYASVSGDVRTVLLDMDGDGMKDNIVFDGVVLTVNGQENRQILLATMPRFAYDPEHGCIVLTGSAGDYSLNLRLENGRLTEEISYAKLL